MDIKRFRTLAGLTESWSNDDDDEGMSKSEKELADKADADLKKKGVTVDKDLKKAEEFAEKKAAAKKAAKDAAKAEEKKPEPKAEEKPEPKAEEKTEQQPAKSAKKLHQAMDWLKANSGASRKDFMTAAEKFGMTPSYAGAYFYLLKKRLGNPAVKEAFIILHPAISKFALTENKQFNQFQWISLEEGSSFDPLVFDTKEQAEKVVKFVNEYKNFDGTVVTLSYDK